MDDHVLSDGQVLTPEEYAALAEKAATREGRHALGQEFPNPVPVAPPIGFVPTEPVHVLMQRMVLAEVRRQREAELGEEVDSEEDAEDFEVGDDYDPSTPYEYDFDPRDPWPMSAAARELEARIQEHRNRSRILQLHDELDALQNGRPWPPKEPKEGVQGGTPPAAEGAKAPSEAPDKGG